MGQSGAMHGLHGERAAYLPALMVHVPSSPVLLSLLEHLQGRLPGRRVAARCLSGASDTAQRGSCGARHCRLLTGCLHSQAPLQGRLILGQWYQRHSAARCPPPRDAQALSCQAMASRRLQRQAGGLACAILAGCSWVRAW